MLKTIILILLQAIASMALAQELVPNGSFECGVDYCTYFQYPQIEEFSKYACGWSVPGAGTSDIYSSKLPEHTCSMYMPRPDLYNHLGSQPPRTGSRFAGIHGYSKGLSSDTTSYREYLQVALNQPLKTGEKYCAEMYVSAAELVNYASNNLGMRFNLTQTFVSHYTYLKFVPQIIEKKIVDDTSKWVRIAGVFEATEPSQYLIIGNFYGDGSTAAIHTPAYASNGDRISYYYIDDVSVRKLPNEQFSFSGVSTICEGQSTTLTASVGVTDVKWTTLEDTLTVLNTGEKFISKPTQSTAYRVTVKGCGKIIADTIAITVNPKPQLDLGKDTVMCKGNKLILNAGPGLTSYRWQDSSNQSTFEVDHEGGYSVSVVNEFNCQSSDVISFRYEDVPKINLGPDGVVCSFSPLIAGGIEYTYEWFDGSVNSTFLPTSTGKFWVKAKNHCGVAMDTITLYSASDIFIPNVITLNDDKLNDHFKVGVNENGTVNTSVDIPFSLSIFNRWGKGVFHSNRYAGNWPASETEPGTYYYLVNVQGCREYKGWVQVIR